LEHLERDSYSSDLDGHELTRRFLFWKE
jgi:hypothetical protein